MHDHTPDELRQALVPLASLISKSEKAQQKLTPGTWQHTMLRDNLEALRIASALMSGDASEERDFTREELEGAARAIGSMIDRTEKAGAKFPPGTSQHSLQRNRLDALRIAEAFVTAEADKG